MPTSSSCRTQVRRITRFGRWVVALATIIATLVPAATAAAATTTPPPAKTLVLYDTTGNWGRLGELYGMMTANLTGHFGTFTAHPVATYKAGELGQYTAAIYVGSTYDEPIPQDFLHDVTNTTTPVVWMYDNIWELTNYVGSPDFTNAYGWNWVGLNTPGVQTVTYKGVALSRSSLDPDPLMETAIASPIKAQVLATATKPGTAETIPYAIRAKNLTYIAEIPFSYITEGDRNLVFDDLLFDALAPTTAVRHRALVRLEDIGPDADPQELRAAADYLASVKVPFSFGVYPRYMDPNNVNGMGTNITLKERPEVVSAIKYMISKGGTMIMHGWTHQYSNVANPYNGVSADDFEFFTAHVDATTNDVVMTGPVPVDSQSWAAGRIQSSFKDFSQAKLPAPAIFEFPHYAGSAADYKAVRSSFNTRYERSLYFSGQLSGGPIDNHTWVGQFFPYVVNDVYGSKVIPENIGNYEPEAYNNHPPRFPADMVALAQKNLVVRDGFASFFFHPYYDLAALQQTVQGIKAAGYTFVSASTL